MESKSFNLTDAIVNGIGILAAASYLACCAIYIAAICGNSWARAIAASCGS